MLRPGPWGAAPIPEATQPGGGTGRWVGCARTVISQIRGDGPSGELGGGQMVRPQGWAGPFLSWVVCLRSISRLQAGRAGFLKSAGHRAQILEHPWSPEATSSRPPTQACSAGEGTSPGERQRAAPWCGEPAGREALCRRPHDLTQASPSSLALSIRHESHQPTVQEAGPEGRRARAWLVRGRRHVAGCSVF